MQRVLIVLFCCLFSVSAQAGISDCVTALKTSVEVNQRTVDLLTQAIVEGDTKTIKELAKPWLNTDDPDYKDPNYFFSFSNDSYLVMEDDLLLFAAEVALKTLYHDIKNTATIESLTALVDMGIKPSVVSDFEKLKWGGLIKSGERLIGSTLNIEPQSKFKEILNILAKAGLTAEKLYLSDGSSMVHEALIDARFLAYFETILSSNLITEEEINLPFKRFTIFTKSIPDKHYNTSLLHWFALTRQYNTGVEKIKILLAHGADPNLAASFRDNHMSSAIVMTPLEVATRAKNNLAVEELLNAGAKEATEESEDRNLLEKK